MINPLPKDIYLKRRKKKTIPIRSDYFRDQTAIIHSMPFRRLKNKTQVFFAPQNDHVCTRIEHVMHVATVGATICKGLNNYGWQLDTELAYAIGLGHDMGHTPFGHSGEDALNEILGKGKFMHELNSYRVVEYLADKGRGLNLTYAVKDGIICHNGEKFEQHLKPSACEKNLDEIKDRKITPASYEGCIVRFADKIAYLGRDMEDAIRAGFIKIEDVPRKIRKEIGETNGEIINTLVIDIIENSRDREEIGFSDKKFPFVMQLREFNYKNIYYNKAIKDYDKYSKKIVKSLFEHLMELYNKFGRNYEEYEKELLSFDRAFGKYLERMYNFYETEKAGPENIVTDYVAGMTDLYALEYMKQITLPTPIIFDIN